MSRRAQRHLGASHSSIHSISPMPSCLRATWRNQFGHSCRLKLKRTAGVTSWCRSGRQSRREQNTIWVITISLPLSHPISFLPRFLQKQHRHQSSLLFPQALIDKTCLSLYCWWSNNLNSKQLCNNCAQGKQSWIIWLRLFFETHCWWSNTLCAPRLFSTVCVSTHHQSKHPLPFWMTCCCQRLANSSQFKITLQCMFYPSL